jgi:hypothetical protein
MEAFFQTCIGGGGRTWLTVALPAPTFLMHVVNLYIKCSKENAAVVNSCSGATGWNIVSGWPRDLHVAEIIKTSFSGKTAFVLWRARSVRHAHKPASPTRYVYLGSVNRGTTTGPEASCLTAGRRVESWWRLRVWVCSRNTLLRAQSKHIMEM